MTDEMTPGQVVYEEWCRQIVPPVHLAWDDLPFEGREGWDFIAEKIIAAKNYRQQLIEGETK